MLAIASIKTIRLCAVLAFVGWALSPAGSRADTPDSTTQKIHGTIEGVVGYSDLNAGLKNWNDQYVRGNFQFTPSDLVAGEISHQSHFSDRGTFVGATYQRIFNEDWYGSLAMGTSDGGFFLPRLRVDLMAYKKWLEKKSLVTNVGFTYYRAKSLYTDRTLILGAAYYFDFPFIMEAGARLNQSNPGSINSRRGFLALTYGYNKRHYLTVRHEQGNEAYQLVGADTSISDFRSRESSVMWRQWINEDMGFLLKAVEYHNPIYARSGVEVGLFVDF
jgi:YaiO family outer membrane protein